MQPILATTLPLLVLLMLAAAQPVTATCPPTDPSERCMYPDSGGSDGEDETVLGQAQACPAGPNGTIPGGIVPGTTWYGSYMAHRTCTHADTWEDVAVDLAGDLAVTGVTGTAGLVAYAGGAPVTAPPGQHASVVLGTAMAVYDTVNTSGAQGHATTGTFQLLSDSLVATDCYIFGPERGFFGPPDPTSCF